MKCNTGRAKEQGLNTFFHNEVLSVLAKHVAVVEVDDASSVVGGAEGDVDGGSSDGNSVNGSDRRRSLSQKPGKKQKKEKKKRMPKYQPNQLVRARWMRGDVFYNGVIVKVNAKRVVYSVLYDDDNQTEENVLEKFIDTRSVDSGASGLSGDEGVKEDVVVVQRHTQHTQQPEQSEQPEQLQQPQQPQQPWGQLSIVQKQQQLCMQRKQRHPYCCTKACLRMEYISSNTCTKCLNLSYKKKKQEEKLQLQTRPHT